MAPSNTAAWLTEVQKPLEVKEAPYPEPKETEIVIENHAVALNPCDFAFEMFGPALFPDLVIPAIVGEDVAGEVVAVGSSVTRFKAGDRVTAHASSAFQKYVNVNDHMAAAIPDSLSYEQASVLPLTFTTALIGLFHKDYLALQHPSLDPKPTGKALLIWGGSTSVGSNAIQLAKAAGYEVYTTASPKNFDYVKKLGASHVFDYNSPTIKDDLVAAFKGKTTAGALAIGGIVPAQYDAIIEACAAVVTNTAGSDFVALAMRPPDNLPAGIKTNFINAVYLHKEKDLGYSLFTDYLSKALAAGTFTPAPPAEVIGSGLESIQKGLEMIPAGVSAKKLVVKV
ncbi:hypothetical protein DL546_008209 [Coniochaeta pulveracea]|uniref:Enoyl reductase (ER) domain-containing protein n=1 Tax=Coniochaeta pulveracea TaxID=177199 RepID=A0A420YEH0_9PEZI|nr:hypothetical protein DL546_008209 [Coniochaeta pulveracea]